MNKNVNPTPYPELNRVLRELVGSLQESLDENFVGAYLQGSFAVGDFDVHSDVDFIVVIEDELTERQVDTLQTLHGRIFCFESPWAQHLEGSYFPMSIMRDLSQRGKPLWYLDHGARSLIRSDHCNTLVVRWVLREKGVVLSGPPPQTLIDPFSADLLRSEIFKVITGWGLEILTDTQDRYNNRFYQGFIVLSYCRMLHDLHTGTNDSKRAGADWAKIHLEPEWSGLIDRAWRCRPDPAYQIRQPADPQDFEKTLRFVEYVIGQARLYMEKEQQS